MATRCHSVRSWRLPSRSFQVSDVATRRLTTSSPLGIERDSGSAPRLPTRITLFTPAIAVSNFSSAIPLSPPSGGGKSAFADRHEQAALDRAHDDIGHEPPHI